jgi:antitoxin ParD1/3/4
VIERWLIKQVGPAYDAIKKNPRRGIPIDKAFSTLRAHHLARLKAAQNS